MCNRKEGRRSLGSVFGGVMLALTLLFFIRPEGVSASGEEPDWRLVVAFHEVDVGAVSKVRRGYTLGWIRRDREETDNRKRFSLLAFDKLSDGATMYTETTTTGSSRWVVIFEYTRDAVMWKGGPKPQTSLALRKGSDLTVIRDKWSDYADKNKYRDHKIKLVLNMTSSKRWLNSSENKVSPFIGRPPILKLPNPCSRDRRSADCKDWRDYNKVVGSVVG